MTTSVTTDITAYINPTAETTGSSKSYADNNSTDFANLLNNANKAFSANNDNSTPASKADDNNKDKTQNTPVENTSQNQEENKISQNNQNENKVSENDTNTDKKPTENKTSENTQADNQNKEVKADNKTDSNKQEDQSEAVVGANTENNVNLPTDNIVDAALIATQVLVDNASTTTANETTPVQNNQTQITQAQSAQQDFSVDTSNLTQNTTAQINAVKAQVQAQQVLSNVKINQANPQQQQASTQEIPQAQTQTVTTAEAQTPVIEVNANILTQDANLTKPLVDENNKQNIQNILNKTALTQEAIEKMNAKVVGVETSGSSNSSSNSNSNNLLNKQNAQEQVVKLTLENNTNSTQNIAQSTIQNIAQSNALNISDVTQTNFAQTLNTSQSQQSQQTQLPKELSKTDILSQINNQINIKNLPEGETTKVNIILKPENLGKINLELVNSKEGLTAHITADNEQVKEILSKNLNDLKENLSSQGVSVQNVTVKVDETQKQSNNMSSFDDWQAKNNNQEFSKNAQNQNRDQKEFSFDEKFNTTSAAEADIGANTEAEITTNNIENTVSISVGSGKVNYKI